MARIGLDDVAAMVRRLDHIFDTSDDPETDQAIEIARALILEVQHYQRVDARLRVVVERDEGMFGVADMVRSTRAEPDSEPVLAVSVQEVLDVLDMEG